MRTGLPLDPGDLESTAAPVPELRGDAAMIVSVTDILDDLGLFSLTLVDAREPERYSGATEPLEATAGHILGASNRHFGLNFDQSGCFKDAEQLRREFDTLLQQRSLESVVYSCGSGVTACHNRFAMDLAGLGVSRIYPGSWSEWGQGESRPIETSL